MENVKENVQDEVTEALTMIHDYIENLLRAITEINEELRGQRAEDTDDFLKSILNGVNFVTEVFNLTRDYLNEEEELMNKDSINLLISDFMNAYKSGSDEVLADALERDIQVYLEQFHESIEKRCY